MGPWLAILAASETEDCQSWVAVRDACLQSKTLATGGVLQEVCGFLDSMGQHGGIIWRYLERYDLSLVDGRKRWKRIPEPHVPLCSDYTRS